MTSNHKLFSEKFFNQLLTIIHKINKRIFEKSLPFANCNPQFKKSKNNFYFILFNKSTINKRIFLLILHDLLFSIDLHSKFKILLSKQLLKSKLE